MSSLGVDVAANMDDASASNAYAELRVGRRRRARRRSRSPTGATTCRTCTRRGRARTSAGTASSTTTSASRSAAPRARPVCRGARGAPRLVSRQDGRPRRGQREPHRGLAVDRGLGRPGRAPRRLRLGVLVANETAGMDGCASPAIAGSTARGAAELSAASMRAVGAARGSRSVPCPASRCRLLDPAARFLSPHCSRASRRCSSVHVLHRWRADPGLHPGAGTGVRRLLLVKGDAADIDLAARSLDGDRVESSIGRLTSRDRDFDDGVLPTMPIWPRETHVQPQNEELEHVTG